MKKFIITLGYYKFIENFKHIFHYADCANVEKIDSDCYRNKSQSF